VCGLAGVAGQVDEQQVALVAAMTGALRHRGPDAEAVERLDGAVLGHRRLRIIDLRPEADQPMADESGRYRLIFNGEIYNYRELRSALRAAGHRFVSDSDTEVIVHLVEEHGTDFPHHLRGMFAVAVWDTEDRSLTLVRDRLGIKPLYYQADGRRLHFSSEARTLPGAAGLLDEYSLACYLQLGWVPGPRTVFEGVRELPPGHRLTWRAGKLEVDRWWQPTLTADPARPGLAGALADSVARHLVADVPVGVFLSAGVDSAVVATLASKGDRDVTAYTVAFPDVPDEAAEAGRLAARLGLRHQVVKVDGPSILASVDDFAASLDQPTVDGLNTWVISREVRARGAVVALSGLGGDELFSGYSTFRHVPRVARLLDVAAPLPGWARAAPAAVMGLSRRTAHLRERKVLDALRTPGWGAAYAAVRGVMSPSEVERLRGGWGRDLRRRPCISSDGAGGGVTRLEICNYLPDQLLRDTDTMSMAHSLEVRVPLLDDEVVAAALASPAGKEELAAAADPSLLALARVPKRTFTLPIGHWLSGPLRPWSSEAVDALAEANLGFDRAELRRLAADFQDRRAGWRPLWALSVLGAWTAKR
jgi:asparagine synthase (glutamine-hydrolysing)